MYLGNNWYIDKSMDFGDNSASVYGWDYSDGENIWPDTDILHIIG